MNVLTNRISTREWMQHANTHPWVGEIPANRKLEHPICPRCEKIALRDKGWGANRIARCPSCGWRGRAEMLFNEYVDNQMYR